MRPPKRKEPQDNKPLRVAVVDTELEATSPPEKDFARFYQRALPEGVAFALGFLDYDDACDAVQRTAKEFLDRWEHMPLERKTVGYFIKAVQRDIQDDRRSEERHGGPHLSLEEVEAGGCAYPLPSAPSPLAVAEFKSEWENVLRTVHRLPSGPRETWMLLREHGYTPEEAAEIRNCSPKTLRNQAGTAYTMLRELLDETRHALGSPLAREMQAASRVASAARARAVTPYEVEVPND